MRVLPPVVKQKQYPALVPTVIHAQEKGTPKNREHIDWKLITDLPVNSRAEAIEKTPLVSIALEDRGLSQDPQIRLPSRVVTPAHRRTSRVHDRDLLPPQLVDFLDDDDQSRPTGSAS